MKLVHEGQIEGRTVKLPVQLGRRPAEEIDSECVRVHEIYLNALRESPCREDPFTLLDVSPAGPGDTTHEMLVAMAWKEPPSEESFLALIIVVNLGNTPA